MSARPASPFKFAAAAFARSRSPTRHGVLTGVGSANASPGGAGRFSPSKSPTTRGWSERMSMEERDDEEAVATGDALLDTLPTRAEHYDVVLERGDAERTPIVGTGGNASSSILPYLGSLVLDQSGTLDASDAFTGFGMVRSQSGRSISAVNRQQHAPMASEADPKFQARLRELLETERSYVKRIEALSTRYAAPLRNLASDADTAVIPRYEAQRLFGNIGEIVGANAVFLKELEACIAGQGEGLDMLGEIIYRNMACFACYSEYLVNFEKARHIEQTLTRTNKRFREFVVHVKDKSSGMGNIGLRELLIEPVQRIPRYTLLIDALLRCMSPADPRRERLEEAVVLASRIASCESDDKDKRAAVMWGCKRAVDGFPPGLISSQRQLIDCVDVEDFPLNLFGAAPSPDALFSPGGSSAASSRIMHCTLLLFDDCVAVVKRASSTSCGRRLLGLDDLNRLADQMRTDVERSGAAAKGPKFELGFRGKIDIMDVHASDLGASDFQLRFARAPSHASGEKWTGRLVRQFATHDTYVTPTSTPSHAHARSLSGPSSASASVGFGAEPGGGTSAQKEKSRWLDNLWRAQALFKTRDGRSHVRCKAITPNGRGGAEEGVRRTIYFNVYQRRTYLAEPWKSVVALHVDPLREADPLPFGAENAPPLAHMRIDAIDEDNAECSFSTNVKGAPHGQVRGALALPELATQLRHLAARSVSSQRDFDPSRTPGGTPSTPSHRGRVVQGLESFGRNLFGGVTPSLRGGAGDVFGGAASPSRKGKGSQHSSSLQSGSHNGSTSTRTYSTAGTSVGSRGLPAGVAGSPLEATRLGMLPNRTPSKAAQALQERYRRATSAGPPEEGSPYANGNDLTPRWNNAGHAQDQASPSTPSRGPEQRTRTRSTPIQPPTNSPVSIVSSPSTRRKPVPSFDARRASEASASPATRRASGSKRPHDDDDDVETRQNGQLVKRASRGPSPGGPRVGRAMSMSASGSGDLSRSTSFEAPGSKAAIKGLLQDIEESERSINGSVEDVRSLLASLRAAVQSGKSGDTAMRERNFNQPQQRTSGLSSGAAVELLLGRLDAWAQKAAEQGVRLADEVQLLTADVVGLLEAPQASSPSSPPMEEVERLKKEAKEAVALRTKVESLTRQCATLTALEKDGRLENTALHTAFNEELDGLYDQLSSSDEVNALRAEVKRTKAERNEARMQAKTLQRELELEKGQTAVYAAILAKHGLL